MLDEPESTERVSYVGGGRREVIAANIIAGHAFLTFVTHLFKCCTRIAFDLKPRAEKY